MGDYTQSKLHEDLENWMTNLPAIVKRVPIKYLAIPGSHDSMTSSITSRSKISPDAGETLERLNCMGPLLGWVICRWVKTQAFDVQEQLKAGIRYFDLRISTKEGTEQLFFVHGQYSDDVVSVFNHIENFLDAHPKELVILDCQHFYDFTFRDHERLIRLIKATFGSKLLPMSHTMDHLTLEFITEKHRYQVIVVYRSNDAADEKFLWITWYFPSPWPDTTNGNKLVEFLDRSLKNRDPAVPFVSQFLLTPTKESIRKSWFSNLKRSCVYPIHELKYKWLAEQSPKDKGLNIVIADFIDMDNGRFPKMVIALNDVYLAGSPKLPPVE